MFYSNNNVVIFWKEYFAHITYLYYSLSCQIVQIDFDLKFLHVFCSNTVQVLVLQPKVLV